LKILEGFRYAARTVRKTVLRMKDTITLEPRTQLRPATSSRCRNRAARRVGNAMVIDGMGADDY